MTKPRKILVVDDEADMVDILTKSLASADYRVVAAFNGNDGIAKAKAEKPDAIVLDLMMPGKDGFETCKELRADAETAHIPVLVLSAVGQHLTDYRCARSMGLELESDDYIDKPVKPAVLLARLAELLRLAEQGGTDG